MTDDIEESTGVMIWLIEQSGSKKNPDGTWTLTRAAIANLATRLEYLAEDEDEHNG